LQAFLCSVIVWFGGFQTGSVVAIGFAAPQWSLLPFVARYGPVLPENGAVGRAHIVDISCAEACVVMLTRSFGNS
jgi:hypothetical protein